MDDRHGGYRRDDTASTSRRTYLMRRLAGGLLLIGIILFFVETGIPAWFNVVCIAVAALLWLLSGSMERRKRSRTVRDERGNAIKRKL